MGVYFAGYFSHTTAHGNPLSGSKLWFCVVRSAKDNELIVVYKMCFAKKLIFFIYSKIPHQTDTLIRKETLSTNICCKISLRMNLF